MVQVRTEQIWAWRSRMSEECPDMHMAFTLKAEYCACGRTV